MEKVALFLQIEAKRHQPTSGDFDLFGRSSFNRYYYAAYLEVRLVLRDLNESWASMQHASIPELLTGQVAARIKQHRKRAMKISDKDAILICNIAVSSVNELADLMKEAYAVRVSADYNPDIPVEPDEDGRFRLSAVSVNRAHQWPSRAREFGQKIKRAWSLLDD